MYSREDGSLLDLVLLPALSCSVQYARSAGYFNATALAMAADGIEALVGNGGTMRLVAGCLTSPQEAEAIQRGELDAARLVAQRHRGVLEVPPGVVRDALELLAWLVAQGRLSVRIALPRRSDDGLLDLGHIFHQKTALFTDSSGDSIGFMGSANETPAGWKYNWESVTLFRSWDGTRDHYEALHDNFERLWAGNMRTAYVIDVPTALREELLRYQPPDGELPKRLVAAPSSPTVSFTQPGVGWREVRNFLSDTPALRDAVAVAAATSAIEPWPHQWSAFRRMFEPWRNEGCMPRLLIADEVGLGKTIEAGLLLRQSVMAGLARRVLVMVPASLQVQWQRELREKFALEWPIYDGERFLYSGRRTGDPDRLRHISGSWWEEPFIIASSHLLRRRDRQSDVVGAEPWDLLVVDEAHHARREAAGTPNEGAPNRMLELLQCLHAAGRLRGLVLLTATPLQTALVEVFDLIALLGLPEGWRDRQQFESFFTLLRRPSLTDRDVAQLAMRVRQAVEQLPDGEALLARALLMAQLRSIERTKIVHLFQSPSPLSAATLSEEQREKFRSCARRATPVAALVSRYTRPLLRQYGVAIARRQPRDLFVALSADELSIHADVERFIRQEFNRAEQLVDRSKRNAIGFVLAVYGKRLGSSLAALRRTLERHLAKLERRFGPLGGDLTEDIDDDGATGLYAPPSDSAEAREMEVRGIAEIEASRVREIVARIAAFHHGADDEKLRALRTALGELQSAGYDQTIVFTQYTDTLEWLRDHLGGYEMLCYSGRGGEWRRPDGSWHRLSRDDTRKRFLAKEAAVLLCTDAAAEGLNLQTCGALVNYDLPWNPMRVEQRIGRIDRIGQPRDIIRIENLYYQGTIETQVYMALQRRIHLFGNVVGKLQPILARTATLIERGILQSGGAEPILSELEREIDQLDREAFDLDASLSEDLSQAANVPAPPYDLEQVSLLLDRPELLPATYRPQPLGTRQWAVALAGGAATRVTSDRAIYEENVEDYELWTPGSRVFPKLDQPRTDVRPGEYPMDLRALLD